TLLTGSMMTKILMNSDESKVAGIEIRKMDGSTEKVNCKALVLGCSTVETARHLLIYTSNRFPNGLANGSGQVGKNLTSHFGITVMGYFPELRGRDVTHDEGTNYYHSLLTGMYWDQPSKNFEGTYQVQCGAGYAPGMFMVREMPGYGAQLKRDLIDYNVAHA